MATVLVVSLSLCIWIMLSHFLYVSLDKRALKVRRITKILFGLSLVSLSAFFTILGGSVAYYFDFNQGFNMRPIVKVCGGLSVIGMVLGMLAVGSLKYKR